mgnify:FL=1
MLKYKYCPYCKGKLSYNEDHYQCLSCKRKVFARSYPGVSVLPVKDGEVLIAKRAREPKKDMWDSIGGFLKEGESPSAAALRETKEETGLDIKLGNLLGIYTDSYTYEGITYETLNLYYLAEIKSGQLKAKDDVSELVWFAIEKLPEDVAFKSFKKALRDLKKWHRTHKRP